jgi:hypothetical protein
MNTVTLKQAEEAAARLNRNVYAALENLLKTFKEESGLQPSHIEVGMCPIGNSYELETVKCVVPHLSDAEGLLVIRRD